VVGAGVGARAAGAGLVRAGVPARAGVTGSAAPAAGTPGGSSRNVY
jgi:hypothetical protein